MHSIHIDIWKEGRKEGGEGIRERYIPTKAQFQREEKYRKRMERSRSNDGMMKMMILT